MPIQAPQWTEFLSCPVCYNVFNEQLYRPISLACGHTVCKTCLSKFQQRKCPFDQSLISRDIDELPANFALLQLVSATASPDSKKDCVPNEHKTYYERSRKCVEQLALLLKPVSSTSTGSIISMPPSNNGNTQNSNSVLSRPMQRKLITLVNCQLVEEEGRARALRAARSLGERTVTELILQHQNPQQLSSNLWAAVRGRGCQFLGPAMQEEVLKLILLALEDGSALSRKVLVLFVVQRLEAQYPQASKTAIGHVVQLLYRASCFKVTKRDEESSLMQLKEDYRTYDTLRREHDSQIVQIAMEGGLRIAPDQWSSLLYGDSTHKSHMQSIIDKLQTPQTFSQSVSELLIALQRTNDPHSLSKLHPELEFLSNIDPSPEVPCPTWENLDGVMRAVKTVVEGLVNFLQNAGSRKHEFLTPFNSRYKTSMCRDYIDRGNCPRGSSCTFAHSEDELERHRQKNKRTGRTGSGPHSNRDDERVPANLNESTTRSRGTVVNPNHRMPFQTPPPKSAVPQVRSSTDRNQQLNVHNDLVVNMGTNHSPGGVEMIGAPHGIVQPVPEVATPSGQPPPVYATPMNQSAPPPMVESPMVVMPPNGDSAILQAGNVVPPGIQQGIQQPQGPVAAVGMSPYQSPPPTGPMGPGSLPPSNAQPGNMMPHGVPQGMSSNMLQMQGMIPPYMGSYGAPGAAMMGPRFPMHPMMCGHYPAFHPMHPYMNPYYTQGYMTPESAQMQYENYYTSLNPFAEPWNPSCGVPNHGPGMPFAGNQCEKCSACCQKQEEHRLRQQQQYHQQQQQQQQQQQKQWICDKHENDTRNDVNSNLAPPSWTEEGQNQCDKVDRKPGISPNYPDLARSNKDLKGKQALGNSSEGTQQVKGKSQNYQNVSSQKLPSYSQGMTQHQKQQNYYSESSGTETVDRFKDTQGDDNLDGYGQNINYNSSDEVGYQTSSASHEHSEWSTYDDDDDDNDDDDVGSNDYKEEQKKELGYNFNGYHGNEDDNPAHNPAQDNFKHSKKSQYQQKGKKWSSSVQSNAEYKDSSRQLRTDTKVAQSNGSSGIPTIPLMSEPNAKLYRQSLNTLRERRNSLIQQLQDINKEAIAHEHKLEELSENLPNLFKFENVDVNEAAVYTSTLKHPEPLDTGPLSLKKTAPSNGEIFERLGAISGVPPRSVNDSIMASWTVSTLKCSDLDDSPVEGSSGLYSSQGQSVVSAEQPKKKHTEKKDKWDNVDQDFPYLKDVTQTLDSPMTTPPSTPCPSLSYSQHTSKYSAASLYNVVSSMASPVRSSYRGTSRKSAELIGGTNTSTYRQATSFATKTSSYGSGSGSKVSSYENDNTREEAYENKAEKDESNVAKMKSNYPTSSTYGANTSNTASVFDENSVFSSSIYNSVVMSTMNVSYGDSSSFVASSFGSDASSYATSSMYNMKSSDMASSFSTSSGHLKDSVRASSFSTSSGYLKNSVGASSFSTSSGYLTSSDGASSFSSTSGYMMNNSAANSYPGGYNVSSSGQNYSTPTSYWPPDSSEYWSGVPSSNSYHDFPSSIEEDHIPFVEGSPIISKYGPISRNVNKNPQPNATPVEVMADDTMKTVPITAVTPLAGPPLPSAQKVPSRFQHDEDGHLLNNKPATSSTGYERSYSLWTTEVNLLEQKAKKASTEDEMLSVKLQAVQMQIALKEQELQQVQLIEPTQEMTQISEYHKNRGNVSVGPWD